MPVILHCEVICIPNRQTVVQWPNPPLSLSPVRCKGPSQGGFSVIRAAALWLQKTWNYELLRLQAYFCTLRI